MGKTIKLTENEKAVLKNICNQGSAFNGDKIDWGKTFEEQVLENHHFYSFTDDMEYAPEGMAGKTYSGVIANLNKKHLIESWREHDSCVDVCWLSIGEKEFNNILSVLDQIR